MSRRIHKSFPMVLFGAVIYLGLPGFVSGGPAESRTEGELGVEPVQGDGQCPSDEASLMVYDGFDLESARTYASDMVDFPLQVDFLFAYNADWDAAVLFQEYPVEIAFLDATSFEEVQYGDLMKLTFTDDLIDLPLDSDDTIVLFTAEGNYFKIGNAELAGDFTVSFDFQPLCPPESDDNYLTD